MPRRPPTARDRIAYHRRAPSAEYWSEQWERESFDRLLEVARHSPLTRYLEREIRPGDRVLEGGCGLGQYVHHFASRGVDISGIDYSRVAVEKHLALNPGSQVVVGDLGDLPFPDASFDVYVSLGVLEHYEDGPAGILAEARRVLVDDGRLIASVPYLSISRRLLRSRIVARERA